MGNVKKRVGGIEVRRVGGDWGTGKKDHGWMPFPLDKPGG